LRNAFLFKGKSYLDQIYQEIHVLDVFLRTGEVPQEAADIGGKEPREQLESQMTERARNV
jgi:hypothetical protein